jgi:hypothetical protein
VLDGERAGEKGAALGLNGVGVRRGPAAVGTPEPGERWPVAIRASESRAWWPTAVGVPDLVPIFLITVVASFL